MKCVYNANRHTVVHKGVNDLGPCEALYALGAYKAQSPRARNILIRQTFTSLKVRGTTECRIEGLFLPYSSSSSIFGSRSKWEDVISPINDHFLDLWRQNNRIFVQGLLLLARDNDFPPSSLHPYLRIDWPSKNKSWL